jgi:hypothetical protein
MSKDITKYMFNPENLSLMLTSIVNDQIKKVHIKPSIQDSNSKKYHIRWSNYEVYISSEIG